eukprot:CAMPEP_0179144348 /NCGR_PEP_ID=MMETSP0796-20121207/69532_1 /TAXON_ID=73915 /ORGANISM="Pyrodinium bahamense, Strain pbaha01" /LENGTH=169 /DNA_ID=CAMNT_0020844553 /DNA_START=51 /DNA_END=557 /DNA_ORIENTATION=+
MADTVSDAGYVIIFVSCALILGLYSPWILRLWWPRKAATAQPTSLDEEGSAQGASDRSPCGLTMRQHCLVGMLGAFCAGAGNIMAYRVVLQEHLQGTIVERRGAMAVVTTLLISVSVLFLFGSHCALLGGGCMPARPGRVALSQCSAVAITLLIIVGKFSMGIVHYSAP